MKAIRFHGRGGQGVKTASRIVGTAAFLRGYFAQDSPIYGPERRGAPVAAFTRIGHDPIRERGRIVYPDLIVVADWSLLNDPAARILEGVSDATVVFVNTAWPPDHLRSETGILGQLCTMDVTDMAIAHIGQRPSLSAALGAITGRLLGLPRESIEQAVAMELIDLGLSEMLIRLNQTLAVRCYETVQGTPVSEATQKASGPAALWTPVYEQPTRGTARITAGANAPLRRTGSWRAFRPVLIPERCSGCWLCYTYCPESVITIRDDHRPVIDYTHCKGCLACVQECPSHALIAVRESEPAPS